MMKIGKVYTAQDMRNAAKCLFACEVDLEHDNRDIARMLRQAADMMDRADGEAAAKRERESTGEKSSAVGNAAKMREALLEASVALSLATHHHLTEDDAKECISVVESALSAPPRNCDKQLPAESVSADDVEQAWQVFKRCDPNVYFDVPGMLRFIVWLFAEVKGETK